MRRTALGTALGVAAVLGVQAAASGAGDRAGHDGPRRLALTELGGGEAVLTRRTTEPFELLGVSWTDPHAEIHGRIEVRTRDADDGEWSDWIALAPHPADLDGARPGAPGSTEPVWVGASDGAEVRISDGGGDGGGDRDGGGNGEGDGGGGGGVPGRLPAGLVLDLIDAGGRPVGADAAGRPGGADAEPAVFTAALPGRSDGPPSSAPRPEIVSRAEWGGEEIEEKTPEPAQYLPGGRIKAVFVHHTAGADYRCADSASIVRSILDYHVDVEKWRDIGYNFLVDKCGTVFEGRKGGIDQPVLGAHTYGWNAESTSVAFIGDFTAQAAPEPALAAAARVIAYKLGQYGVDPRGRVRLTAGATQKNYFGEAFTYGQVYEFDAVSGHRSGFATECPGDSLYPQLPGLRDRAAGGGGVLGLLN
ncbi:peptidoglycan recognition protein [Streptomyces sp. NPDC004327]|uniref:peptidoglycan recognition protein family protein n=1 Tax=Streptomyces sp. NPDC004327 TaxID=3364699 RepID=UPI0036757EC4